MRILTIMYIYIYICQLNICRVTGRKPFKKEEQKYLKLHCESSFHLPFFCSIDPNDDALTAMERYIVHV